MHLFRNGVKIILGKEYESACNKDYGSFDIGCTILEHDYAEDR